MLKKISSIQVLITLFLTLLSISACNKDDSISSGTVDFGTAPSSTLVPSASVEIITENTVRYHVINFLGDYPIIIVETESGIVLVDAGSYEYPDIGRELRLYADAINKSMSIIITHSHFDHWGGLSDFGDITVYTTTAVATSLLAEPDFSTYYSGTVNSVASGSSQTLAGVSFDFYNVSNTETTENAYVTIPSLKALFIGDLGTGGHEYIREYTPLDSSDELDSWIAVLNLMKTNFGNYNHIFFGHYVSTTSVSTELDRIINYIEVGQGLIKGTRSLTAGGTATSVQEVVDELLLLYPDLPVGGLLFALPNGFYPGDPGAIWF